MTTQNFWGETILVPQNQLDRKAIRQIVSDQLLVDETAQELSPYCDGPGPLYYTHDVKVELAGDDGIVRVRLGWVHAAGQPARQHASELTCGVVETGGGLTASVLASGRWRPWCEHWEWMTAAGEGPGPDS
jgi:hypothetical protein